MAQKIDIMVVDDNPANLKLVGDILEIEGFRVERYVDAELTLEGLKQYVPQLILLDIELPGMNGTQLMQKLKEDTSTSGIKIVALTANAMKGDKERLMKAGFDGYLTKPIETRLLKSQISEYLVQ